MTEVMQNDDNVVRGLRFPSYFRKDFVEESLNYVQAPDDILVVSYPKCGVHWLTHLLGLILSDFNGVKPAVYLEAAGDGGRLPNSSPRVVFTHMTSELLGSDPNKLQKVIYLCRIPSDVVVSYHYHCCTLSTLYNEEPRSLQDFVSDFLNGRCCYGCYFAHIRGWLQASQCKILLITYEQLQLEFAVAVERIVEFIGMNEWFGDEKQAKLRRLQEETNVFKTKQLITDQLKDLINGPEPPQVEHLNDLQRGEVKALERDNALTSYVSAFARNGVIGEGSTALEAADLRRLGLKTMVHLGDTPLLGEWTRLGFGSCFRGFQGRSLNITDPK